jgi:hypothetical protein
LLPLLPRSTVLDANGLSGHGDPSIVVFDGIEVDEVIQTRAGDTMSEEDAPQLSRPRGKQSAISSPLIDLRADKIFLLVRDSHASAAASDYGHLRSIPDIFPLSALDRR